jgi:hypothetical protein
MTSTVRDIYGNPVAWSATGRRRVNGLGEMRAEMRRGESTSWMYCRPHEDCAACTDRIDHDNCPRSKEEP